MPPASRNSRSSPSDYLTERCRERLAAALKAQTPRLTQAEVAARAGLQQQDISRFFRRRQRVPMTTIDQIARVVGLTLVDLLQDAAPRHREAIVNQTRVAVIARALARLTSPDLLDLAAAHTALLVRLQQQRQQQRDTPGSPPSSPAAAIPTGGTRRRRRATKRGSRSDGGE